jgi:hypothetical protein
VARELLELGHVGSPLFAVERFALAVQGFLLAMMGDLGPEVLQHLRHRWDRIHVILRERPRIYLFPSSSLNPRERIRGRTQGLRGGTR